MAERNPIYAVVALMAGITVGMLAWLVFASPEQDGALTSFEDGADLAIGRSVGVPSEPFSSDASSSDASALPPIALPFESSGDFATGTSTPGSEATPSPLGSDEDEQTNFGPNDTPVVTGSSSSSIQRNPTTTGSTNQSGSTNPVDQPSADPRQPDPRPAQSSTTAQPATPRSAPTTASSPATASSPTTAAAPATTPTTSPRQQTPTTQAATTAAPTTASTAAPAAAGARSGVAAVYVAANGDDSNPGTQQQPVGSFARAVELSDPGHSIVFAPGTYAPLRITNVNGTSNNPIRIVGTDGVEFRSSSYSREAGILVRDSTNIEIVGVEVRHALWGVYIQNSHGIKLLDSDIGDIGQEAVRIKDASSHVLIEGNSITDTGRRTDNSHANGEGVYIGTGTPGNVDQVTNVTVRNNSIARLTDEAVDIKIPTTNITIEGNTITDVHTQTTGAVVVHLNSTRSGDSNISVVGNSVSNVTRSSPYRDGNCIVTMTTVRIANNTLTDCQHRGIFVQGSAGTATIVNNTLRNAGSLGDIVDDGRGMSIVSRDNTIRD